MREFRPYFDNAPVYGHGPSLEDFMEQTPLTVGSPQQVIERTLGFREYVGDYQRQLFLMDHAGLPLKTVLEQLDILGSEVVPVLRREFSALRPSHVPSDPPTHPRLAGGGARPTGSSAEIGTEAVGSADSCPFWGPHRGGKAMTFTLAVVTAGLGQPSSTRLLADRLADAATAQLQSAGHDVLVEVVELRPLAHALADNLLTGFPNAELEAAISTVTNADALIAVTPIFTASYSGLFKTFFDVIDKNALTGKPTLIGATAGTARHSLALDHAVRPLFGYLRAVVVPTGVFAATEDFGATTDHRLGERVDRAAAELVGLLVPQGPRPRTSPDASGDADEVTPFEELLRGGR